MTEQVCKYIADRLKAASLNYLGRIEGAATVAELTDKDGAKKRYPFSHEAATCDRSHAITPNEKEKGVLWMEPGEVQRSTQGSAAIRGAYQVPIRVIGWVNLKKLGTTDRALTAQIEAALIQQLESLRGTGNGTVSIVSINYARTVEKSLAIFNRYSFRTDLQWWFGKFDYFAQDYGVTFTITCEPNVNDEVC